MAMRKLVVTFAAAIAALAALTASASGAQSINPQVLDDSQLKAMTTTIGGADVLPSTRTVPHCSAKR